MSTNYDMDALFHPKIEIKEGKFTSKEGEYRPSADQGKNGVYQSIIRFVTWWQEPHKSYIDKWVCWLVDPVTNRGRTVDCPSSIGKPSPLQDMFFKLRNSESVQMQQKAEIFSRKHSYSALIQVIKDEQNKDLEGKILVWNFGVKVFDKLKAESKPIIGDPNNPFDLLYGKIFSLTITKVKGFNNYDQSKFLDKVIPLLLPISAKGELTSFTEEHTLKPINDKTSREIVFNFLKENSPDLSEYSYKEWDQETHEYVNQVILAVTGSPVSSSIADVRNSPSQKMPAQPSKVSHTPPVSDTGITTTEITLDDLNIDSNLSADLPSLDLPDISSDDPFGLGGNLDDALAGL